MLLAVTALGAAVASAATSLLSSVAAAWSWTGVSATTGAVTVGVSTVGATGAAGVSVLVAGADSATVAVLATTLKVIRFFWSERRVWVIVVA